MNRTSCSCSCYRMHAGAMEINERWTDARSGSVWFALWGGMAGAIAASACCILPLALFGAGVSGAWIGNFTQLSPWQPYFIAATLLCLGSGYWLVYRSSKQECAEGAGCEGPLPRRLGISGLIWATGLRATVLPFSWL